MREFIESGFKVTVPEKTSFRFCENPAYMGLSGLGVKEMDIGWWEPANNRLVFLELKGIEIWRNFDRSNDTAHAHLVKSLKGKVTDVLLMLAAVWVETIIGKGLKKSLPGFSNPALSGLHNHGWREIPEHPYVATQAVSL